MFGQMLIFLVTGFLVQAPIAIYTRCIAMWGRVFRRTLFIDIFTKNISPCIFPSFFNSEKTNKPSGSIHMYICFYQWKKFIVPMKGDSYSLLRGEGLIQNSTEWTNVTWKYIVIINIDISIKLTFDPHSTSNVNK